MPSPCPCRAAEGLDRYLVKQGLQRLITATVGVVVMLARVPWAWPDSDLDLAVICTEPELNLTSAENVGGPTARRWGPGCGVDLVLQSQNDAAKLAVPLCDERRHPRRGRAVCHLLKTHGCLRCGRHRRTLEFGLDEGPQKTGLHSSADRWQLKWIVWPIRKHLAITS